MEYVAVLCCYCISAKESIGRGYHSDLELFEESFSQLKLLIDTKNETYQKLLQSGMHSHRRTLRKLQQKVQKAAIRVKEGWINKVAALGDRWNIIRILQRVHYGYKPVRTTLILKLDGELTKGLQEE